MGDSSPTPPHVLLVSFPAQGHVNPLLRLAKRLAAAGLLVTFSSTSDAGRRISASTASPPGPDGVPFGLGHLRFEFLHDDWPPDDPRRFILDDLLPHIESIGRPALSDLIQRQADAGRPVSCVVSNPFVPWALDVAAAMSVPCAVLWIQSCAVFSTYYHYHHRTTDFPSETNPDLSVTLPGLPTMSPDELPSFLLPTNPYTALTKIILEQFRSLSKATWVLANSFLELERDVINAVSETSPIIPIGPLVEQNGESGSDIKGDFLKAADCVEWLDGQPARSVIYVSLGSIAMFGKEETAEMARALKSGGRPFLWVVRAESRGMLPEGFVEETKDIGMVVGWSPQDRVLSHGAVGCFVTHCGWNSTLEAVAAGVPVVAYPQWGDQLTNAKFLVDIYKVGVRLRPPVKREELRSTIEEVMSGAKADEVRRRAAGWREVARVASAAVDGGSSDRNFKAFVEEIRRRACGVSVL